MVSGRVNRVRSAAVVGGPGGVVGSNPVQGTRAVDDGEGVIVRIGSETFESPLERVQEACGQSLVPSRTPSTGGRTVKVFVPETTA